MIYEIVRFWVGVALKFYYRSIHFINEHNIPDNEPVIIAANHSNSAIDAYNITCHYKRNDLYWLARGDAFNNKFISWIMYKLKTAPIYRASDMGGVVDHTKNQESFEKCFEILNQNKMIGIFPEAITIHERRLQKPLKKGTARLAFQAHIKLGRSVKIVPVGISYRSLTQIGTDAFVVFGKPIATEDFIDIFNKNNSLGINKFNEALEKALLDIIINYHDLGEEIDVIPALENAISYKNSAQKNVLSNNVEAFENEKKLVQNWALKKPEKINYPKNNDSIITKLAMFLIYPINQFIKNFIANKIKKKEFYSTARISLGILIFPIYVFVGAIILGFIHWTLVWVWAIGLPFLVFYGLRARYQNQ